MAPPKLNNLCGQAGAHDGAMDDPAVVPISLPVDLSIRRDENAGTKTPTLK